MGVEVCAQDGAGAQVKLALVRSIRRNFAAPRAGRMPLGARVGRVSFLGSGRFGGPKELVALAEVNHKRRLQKNRYER